MFKYVQLCSSVCIYTYMYMYIYIYQFIYMYIYIYTYIYTQICLHMLIHGIYMYIMSIFPIFLSSTPGQYGTTGYTWQPLALHPEASPFEAASVATWTADGAAVLQARVGAVGARNDENLWENLFLGNPCVFGGSKHAVL